MNTISVIIPIFNVEKYLDECLLSVRNQTYPNLEIICINDGSTDSSLKILEKHAAADKRIRIVSQQNAGQSAARNAGIAMASGKYCYFLDSDDKIVSNALEILYHTAEADHLQLIMFSAMTIYENDTLKRTKNNFAEYYRRRRVYKEVMTGQNLYMKLNDNDEYFVQPCCLFIHRKFLDEHQILFIEGMIHEDNVFCFTLMMKAERCRCINDALFIRRMREGSAMTELYSTKRIFGRIRAAYEILAVARKSDIAPELLPIISRECASLVNSALSERQKTPDQLNGKLSDIGDTLFFNALGFIKYSGTINKKDDDKFIWPLKRECDAFLARQPKGKALLSVIVPVYNARAYLTEALDSICKQTMNRLEIVCIDDGSTDGSSKILDNYAARDSRFKVIHQDENYGHGYSVNIGLRNATSDYIGFLDADDFLDSDAFASLYTAVRINRLDFIKANIINYYQDRDPTENDILRLSLNANHYNRILNPRKTETLFFTPAQNVSGVYSKDFLLNHSIFYGEKPHAANQDVNFTFKSLFYATRIAFVDKAYYHYRRDAVNSLSQDDKRASDIMDVFAELYNFLKEQQVDSLWGVFERSKFLKYTYSMTKMSGERLFQFIYAYRNELLRSEEEGMLDLSSFSYQEKKDIQFIINAPDQFFAALAGKISAEQLSKLKDFEQETRRAYARRTLSDIYVTREVRETKYKIAVVIPVFNAVQFLPFCLNSVLGQTLGGDIQVIAVDDGSTDDSLDILSQYARKYNNLTVLMQSNKGAGPARNLALDTAWAEYVAFLDADDTYASDDVLEALYNKAVEDDLRIVGGWRLKQAGDKRMQANENPDDQGLLKYSEHPIDFGYQSYIYDLDMINSHGLRFPDYRRYQDPPFFVRAMLCSGWYYVVDKVFYVYRVGSKTINWNARRVTDYALGLLDELKICVENDLFVLCELIKQRLTENYKMFSDEMMRGNIEVLRTMFEIDNIFKGLTEVFYSELEPIKVFKQLLTQNTSVRQESTANNQASIITELKKKLKNAEERIDSYRHSNSWRVGRIITYLPRQIKCVIVSLRKDGITITIKRIRRKLGSLPKIIKNF